MAILPHSRPWQTWQVDDLPKEVPKYLADTETSVLGGQVHEAVMIKPIAFFVLGTLAAVVAFGQLPASADIVLNLIIIGWVALVGWVWWRWFEWTRELTFISGYRMIKLQGIIIREVRMMPIGKVTDMTYTKSPLGMILGYGTFIVESAGQDQAFSKLPFIPEPDETYRYIQNLLFGKGTTNVNIVDVSTDKRLQVGWSGRFRKDPAGRGGQLDQNEQNQW